MMQFVDQGLVDLDDPVKKYLPQFDQPVETELTFRHLFTHTNGLWGHGTWGADWNSSLENVIGQYLPYLEVGKRREYNGIGYALQVEMLDEVTQSAWQEAEQLKRAAPKGTNRNAKVIT